MVCIRPERTLGQFLIHGVSLYVYNKIDSVSLDFLDKLAREPNTVVMSCELDLGIQDVIERCWAELRLMRIYTKRYEHSYPVQINFAYDRTERGKTRISARR